MEKLRQEEDEMIVCLNIERHKILVHLPNPQHADMLADLLEEDADYWRFGLRLSPVELSYPEAVELQNRLEAALTAVKRLKEAGKEGVEIQYYSPHDHPELQPEPRLCPECDGPLTPEGECLNHECKLYGPRSCDNCEYGQDAKVFCPGPCTYDNGLPHWTRRGER